MGSCRTFPGGASTDNLATSSTLTLTTTFSMSVWLKTAAVDATARRLYIWGPAGGNNEFRVADGGGGLTSLQFKDVGWTGAGQWNFNVTTDTTNWHHILVVYDAGSTSNNASLYYDGVLKTAASTVAPTGSHTNSANVMVIGNDNSAGGTRCLNGSVAGFAGWNVLLSSTDALALSGSRAAVAACDVQAASRIFHFPLDNGDSPETELVGSVNATVTGTTVGTGPSQLLNPRCGPTKFAFVKGS